MAKELINIGNNPNDGSGDPLRTAFSKCNNNFNELYSRLQSQVPASAVGSVGDFAGMIAVGSNPLNEATYGKFFYCFADYDGSTEIWRMLAGTTFDGSTIE
jgi:hypothetical protein